MCGIAGIITIKNSKIDTMYVILELDYLITLFNTHDYNNDLNDR